MPPDQDAKKEDAVWQFLLLTRGQEDLSTAPSLLTRHGMEVLTARAASENNKKQNKTKRKLDEVTTGRKIELMNKLTRFEPRMRQG